MSKTTIKVSVIVPVYNVEKYLPQCLDSLISQELKNLKKNELEIICINDCSTDNSPAILDEYVKKDPRIKVFKTKTNSGLSVSRNLGIKKSQGKYIMLCDSDDFFNPAMCEKMYTAIEESDTDLAICGINVIYHTHHEMKDSDDAYYGLKFHGRHFINSDVMARTDVASPNRIYRRSILEKYHIEFPVGLKYEDAFFNNAYMGVSRSVYFVNEKLYNYIRHKGSIMSSTWNKKDENDFASDHLDIAFRIYDFFKAHNLLEEYNQLFWQLYSGYLNFAVSLSKTSKKRNLTRARSRKFIKEHKAEFQKADKYDQKKITAINSKYLHKVATGAHHITNRSMPRKRLQLWALDDLTLLQEKNNQISDRIQNMKNQVKNRG